MSEPRAPMNEAKVAALLEDGRIVDLIIRNFGWQSSHYETEFEFDGVVATSKFITRFHAAQFCSEPDVRFARDYEALEDAIARHFGCALHDIEVD